MLYATVTILNRAERVFHQCLYSRTYAETTLPFASFYRAPRRLFNPDPHSTFSVHRDRPALPRKRHKYLWAS